MARDSGLTTTDIFAGNYKGLDDSTVLNLNGAGRQSIKLISRQPFAYGLIITGIDCAGPHLRDGFWF
jgi:hypothetical protein